MKKSGRLYINLFHEFEYTDKLNLTKGLDKGFDVVVCQEMMRSIKNMLFKELVCDNKSFHELSKRIAHEKEQLLEEKIESVIMNFKLSIHVYANDPVGRICLRMNEIEE